MNDRFWNLHRIVCTAAVGGFLGYLLVGLPYHQIGQGLLHAAHWLISQNELLLPAVCMLVVFWMTCLQQMREMREIFAEQRRHIKDLDNNTHAIRCQIRDTQERIALLRQRLETSVKAPTSPGDET